MAALTFKPGILNYGDDDDSIIYRSPFTSAAAITTPEIGGATAFIEIGTGTSFDSILGMNPGTAGGYRFQAMDNYLLLDNQGHITCEIEKEWICYNDPTNGSSGYVPGATSAAITTNATVGGAMTVMQKTVGGALQSWIDTTIYNDRYRDYLLDTGTTVNALIQSQVKKDFVTVDVWWNSGLVVLMIDKVIIAAGQRPGSGNSGRFANMYYGSDRGIGGFMGDFHMRNVQIASRSPSLQSHAALAKVGVLSDSLFNTDSESSVYRDTMTTHVMRREFTKVGLRAGKFYVDVNGGFTAFTTGANDLSTRVTALLAENPTIVCLSMGTNDIITDLAINTAWDADIKTNILDPIIADDKVQNIYIGTITSLVGNTAQNTAARQASLLVANDFIRAWGNYDSKIKIIDRYVALGQETPDNDTYIGQLDNTFANLHYAPIGLDKVGIGYANSILQTI